MALTLTNSIDATQREFAVTGTVTIEPGYRFRLGDELLELQGFVQPRNTVHVVRNLWYVRRGLDLSTAATHANGTEVKGATDAFVSAISGTTPPDPFADGGPGGSVAASDVTVSPEVAGASDVQGALEGLAAGAVRTLDLGSILAMDLLSGRVVIYTPADGEFIKAISYGLDTVLPDAAFVIFETPSRQSEALSYAKAMVGPSPSADAYNAFDSPAGMMGLAVGGGQPFYTPLDPGPLTASLCWNGIISDETAERGHVLETPGWEADHVYAATVEVIQSAHIWTNDGGTSGGSLPDFAGNIGGTVTDNGITWTDKADVPTEGSVHLYIDVVTP